MTGNAGWEWKDISASFKIAKEDTINMYLDLRKNKNPVELLSFGYVIKSEDIKSLVYNNINAELDKLKCLFNGQK
jgi:hypothetical protein